MNATTSGHARKRGRAAKVLLGLALLIAGSLIAGGALAGGAERPTQKGKLVVNAVWDDTDVVHGLLYARQRGERMRISAVLVELEPDQRYVLGFSRNGCRRGSGGLLRKRIRFTSSAAGHAVAHDTASPKLLEAAKSAVLLTRETGREFQHCARLNKLVGDYDGDGVADGADNLVANALLRATRGSGDGGGIFNWATGPGTPNGIIGILIALKSDQRYVLGFSRNSCRRGSGGLLRKRIPATSSPEGHIVVQAQDKASPKLLERARSVVLLTKETGNRFQACGRFDLEYTMDGDDL